MFCVCLFSILTICYFTLLACFRILLFPSFPARYRFLLHSTVASGFEELGTLSVGHGLNRRTAVFNREMENKPSSNSHDIERLNLKLQGLSADSVDDGSKVAPKRLSERKKRQLKRPDKALYSPPCSKAHEEPLPELAEQPKFEPPTAAEVIQDEDDSGGDSWDALYDDNGEALNSDQTTDLRNGLKLEADTQIKRTTIDYSKFELQAPDIEDSEFPHVLEISSFHPDMKTTDLVTTINCAG